MHSPKLLTESKFLLPCEGQEGVLSHYKGTLNEPYVYCCTAQKLKFLRFMFLRKIKLKPGCIRKKNYISSLVILFYIPLNGIKSFRLHPAHFKSKC